MGLKRISIIGGGISGLTVLHYLKQRFGSGMDITLWERETQCGGAIRSLREGTSLFEWGPNGFLNNQPATLQLVQKLGLSGELVTSNTETRGFFIQSEGRLYPAPLDPVELVRTPLLSIFDKYSLIRGIFKRNISQDTSVYNYISRRFSINIAERLADPCLGGIYAGNIKRLHMASTFPKLKRQKSRLYSLRQGMGQIIESLTQRYRQDIHTGSEISSAPADAHAVILATPAYAASQMIEASNPVLAKLLDQMPYAPMAIAALSFPKNAFKKKPQGLGYLVPSREGKDILGVLMESNVFPDRAGPDEMTLRVMLGGGHHPAIINDSPEQILSLAMKELNSMYGLLSNPQKTFVKIWPKAIPQYELHYPQWRKAVAEQCAKTPGLYLCANYLDGVSFNDCVHNAKTLAFAVNI